MKIEILQEKENRLLERKEVKIKVIHDGPTPSRTEVRDKLIATLKTGKDTVILDSFKSKFGSRESVGKVRIYKAKDRAIEVEDRHVLAKNFPEEFGVRKAPKKPKPEKLEKKEVKKPEKVEKPGEGEVKVEKPTEPAKKEEEPKKGEEKEKK
jgi:small subunit ribosomal protein S24e